MTAEVGRARPLSGRRVLITGASSGMGEAVARAAVSAGAQVALLARSADRLAQLADELGAVAVPADVTDVEATRDAVAAAAGSLAGLDAIVASAGVARPGTVAGGDATDFKLMLDVNVLGLLHSVQAALPHLIDSGVGDVVVLSSMSGRRVPRGEMGVYSGTKFAVHAIAEGLRLELDEQPVRVTTIAPGYVDTAIADDVSGEQGEAFRDAVASHGMAPSTVASLIVTALAAPREAELVELAVLPTGEA
ncbi:SDR family oxidoreductase [soil metagenome]